MTSSEELMKCFMCYKILAPPLEATVDGHVAVVACAGMALFYVAILYAPTFLLGLSPPRSLNSFMIRRFMCAIVSSIVSIFTSFVLLNIKNFGDISRVLQIYGIRRDHLWQAVVFPVLLTSLPYMGSLVSKFLLLASDWREASCDGGLIMFFYRRLLNRIFLLTTNVMAWRNYLVAPLTEELVFRTCMIPLLLCGGFRTYAIVFLCPIFFSLAHLNKFLELYFGANYSIPRALMVVGVQLGYTVAFGWYASFLFMRTGNFLSPFVAHIVCNSMGLPVWSSSRSKVAVLVAFLGGFLGFFSFLFPATDPGLYNDVTDGCSCWHGYCNWN